MGPPTPGGIAISDNERRRLTRRRFLQMAGSGAGVAMVAPVLTATRAAALTSPRLKLGLLLPSGGEYPSMAANLADGLKVGLGRAGIGSTTSVTGLDVPLGFEGAGGAARTLLASGVDAVVAGVTAPAARFLLPIFRDAGVPLIVANAGGHLVGPSEQGASVLHVSLGYWQAAFAMGRWAASNGASPAVVATSLADSGYDAVFAFRTGLESAGGRGSVAIVTHQADWTGVSGLAQVVGASGARAVYALYTGSRALDAMRALRGVSVQVLAGPFAVDESLLPRLGAAAVGVRSTWSWSPKLTTADNGAFVKAFRSRTGRDPDSFAVLGHDAATLVATGLARAGSPGDLVAALDGATVASPRGQLRVDSSSGTVLAPQYLRRVRSVNGSLVNTVIGSVDDVPSMPAALSGLAASTPSGYLNEVLCPG